MYKFLPTAHSVHFGSRVYQPSHNFLIHKYSPQRSLGHFFLFSSNSRSPPSGSSYSSPSGIHSGLGNNTSHEFLSGIQLNLPFRTGYFSRYYIYVAKSEENIMRVATSLVVAPKHKYGINGAYLWYSGVALIRLINWLFVAGHHFSQLHSLVAAPQWQGWYR
jgi:hypothetical protein